MSTKIIGFIFLFALLVGGCKKNNQNTNLITYEGYLMDQTCGLSGKGMDKTNVAESPQDHTKECLLFCEASGYGLVRKDMDTDLYTFIKFDQKGHDLAKDYILNSSKEKGFSVKVTGTIEDNLLKVDSILDH